MNNLSRLLQKIKDSPVMYLGKPSLTCLHSFLIGYLSSRSDLGLDREGTILDGFQEWIQKREKTQASRSWAGIILCSNISERSAFYRFFELLDEFLHQKDGSSISKNIIEEKFRVNGNDLKTRVRELYELLEAIKKRPGMYLGTSSITRLDMLLRGCNLARREAGIAPTEQEKEFEGFQSWIQEKYDIKSGQSWAKIILFYSVDEYEALEKFFELYEEYLNRDKSSEVDEGSKHIKV